MEEQMERDSESEKKLPTKQTGSVPHKAEESSNSKIPKASNLPPEIISKIYGYIEQRTPMLVCNLALVNENFLEFFTQPQIWSELDETRNYALLRSDGVRIWNSTDIAEWYVGFINRLNQQEDPPLILPGEIWRHRNLLDMVLMHLKIECAPSPEDLKLHQDNSTLTLLLIDHMVSGDCFSYLSSELRRDEVFVLAAVKRHSRAIVHCAESLLSDRKFIRKAVNANAKCLEFLTFYREDPEIVLLALRETDEAFYWALGQLRKDLDKVSLLKPPKYAEKCRLCHRKSTCYHNHSSS